MTRNAKTAPLHEVPLPPVAAVPLRALRVNAKEFSPRHNELDRPHVNKLASVLRDGRQLDPLTIWQQAQGGAMIVIDGHHRHAAYVARRWPKPVPVRVYRGSRAMALRLAAQENGKLRLPLTNTEKLDWAWRIVREAGDARAAAEMTPDGKELADLSQQDIAAMAGVGKSTVINMRKAYRLFEEQDDLAMAGGYIAPTGSWRQDQRAINGSDMTTWTEQQVQEWRTQAVAELTDKLAPALKRHLNNRPDVIAEALATVLGRRTSEVAKLLQEETGAEDEEVLEDVE